MSQRRASVILCLSLLLLASACGSESSAPGAGSDSSLTATLADSGETYLLRDNLKPLGNITSAISVEGNRLVVADDQPLVVLFEDHVMTRTFGRAGNGPCEYGGNSGLLGVTALDTSGDSLFVLINSQQKIITFSLRSGECLGETSHHGLLARQYLERVAGGFLTGRSHYSSNTPDTTRILSYLSDDETMVPVDLVLESIDAAPTTIPIVIPGINFARHNNQIYAAFPFSQVLAEVEVPSFKVHTHALHIEINREAFEEAESNPGQDFAYIGQADIAGRIHATNRWIAVSTRRPRNGKEPLSKIYFQSPAGDPMGQQTLDDTPFALQGNRLMFIEPVRDPESDYTYRVTYREVTLQ
ncbi:MAG: hypothetical protein U5K31_10300 [Balneolaceae bacterium]|nr:hypothetical protein [Balneolaceae bacterium]